MNDLPNYAPGKEDTIQKSIERADYARDVAKHEAGYESETVEQKVKPMPQTTVAPPPVAASTRGVQATNMQQMKQLATTLLAGGALPKQYDSAAKVFSGIQLCYELGLPPMSSLKYLYIVNGAFSLWGDVPLSLVLRSSVYKIGSHREVFFKEGGEPCSPDDPDLFGCQCSIARLGETEIHVERFTQRMAIKAGLWGKGVWRNYPYRMLQMRARSAALKNKFPDVLQGMDIAEYDHNQLVNERDLNRPEAVRDAKQDADELTELLSSPPKT